jgi:taurine-pyruvate aminotransferase
LSRIPRQYGAVPNYGERAADAIEEVILREGPDTIGAICLEPVTAGGGVIVPPAGYWERVQDICRKYDILIHIDEVVCGVGRTGEWFGYQHFGVKPDFVTMAKGVASGYAAISCTVTTEAVFEMFKDDAADPISYFRDISTFGGCASGPAAALENMRIIEDEKLLDNTNAMGERLIDNLHALMDKHERHRRRARQGAVLRRRTGRRPRRRRNPADEKKVAGRGRRRLHGAGRHHRHDQSVAPGLNNTLCLSPALIATADDIDEITNAIDKALTRVFS